MTSGGLQGAGVLLKDVIPVEVHIIETITGNQLLDEIGGAVGGKADPAAQTLVLKSSGAVQTPTRAERPFCSLPIIDPVKREEIHPWKS
jgi:hypothetical protein